MKSMRMHNRMKRGKRPFLTCPKPDFRIVAGPGKTREDFVDRYLVGLVEM